MDVLAKRGQDVFLYGLTVSPRSDGDSLKNDY